MSLRNRIGVLAIVVALVAGGTARAQRDSSNDELYFASLGPSTTTLGGLFKSGFGFQVALTYGRGATTYSLIFAGGTSEFKLFQTAEISIAELGATIGRIESSRWWQFAYAGGVAFVYTEKRGAPTSGGGWFSSGYATDKSYGAALIAQTSYLFTPVQFIGIGPYIYASLNTTRPYLALGAMLRFGRMP